MAQRTTSKGLTLLMIFVLVVINRSLSAIETASIQGGDGDGSGTLSKSDQAFKHAFEQINRQAGGTKDVSSFAIDQDHDEYSNLDLNRLLEANRYQVITPQPQQVDVAWIQRDYNNLAKLFAKILNLPKSRDYVVKNLKRGLRDFSLREDKDYSFVSAPQQAVGSSRNQQQQQQRAAELLWAAQKLRDLEKAAPRRLNGLDLWQASANLDQLSQQQGSAGDNGMNNGNSIESITDDLLPKAREKRRRCKMDPNLGVKNPSYCDTDAYFGAADYSMRDVWDSAGR